VENQSGDLNLAAQKNLHQHPLLSHHVPGLDAPLKTPLSEKPPHIRNHLAHSQPCNRKDAQLRKMWVPSDTTNQARTFVTGILVGGNSHCGSTALFLNLLYYVSLNKLNFFVKEEKKSNGLLSIEIKTKYKHIYLGDVVRQSREQSICPGLQTTLVNNESKKEIVTYGISVVSLSLCKNFKMC
jgi:hypothetical protein